MPVINKYQACYVFGNIRVERKEGMDVCGMWVSVIEKGREDTDIIYAI